MTVTDNGRIDAPREDLVRMTESVRVAEDGNTLVGYAAVFNRWAEIDSWEGRFKERIAPGAFKKTIAERGDKVKVLFNHGMDPTIGNKPLGKPTVIEEDGRGLKVEVPLDDTSYNADIKALLRSGALDGMSFRMTVVQDDWDKLDAKGNQLPERTIKEVRLIEFGPVTFPAYEATKAGVRAHAPRAFEAWRSATGTPEVTVPDEERDESADPEVTDAQDSGPDGQPTRGTDDDQSSSDYQPDSAAPPRRRLTPARLAADLEFVQGMTQAVNRRVAENERLVLRYEAEIERTSQ